MSKLVILERDRLETQRWYSLESVATATTRDLAGAPDRDSLLSPVIAWANGRGPSLIEAIRSWRSVILWCLPSLVLLGPGLATGNRWDVSIGLAATITFLALSAYIQLSFRKMNGWWMDVLEALLVLSVPFVACFILWFVMRTYAMAQLWPSIGVR